MRSSATPPRPTTPRALLRALRHDRRGIAAIILGLLAVPLIGLIGLALDYSFAIRSQTLLNSAADAAAIVASDTAANTFQAGCPTSLSSCNIVSLADSAGQAAGLQAFNAQLINIPNVAMGPAVTGCTGTAGPVCVVVTQSSTGSNSTFTTTINYNSTYTTWFGALFRVATFPISGNSTAEISSYAYVNVTFLLDNSSSMLIAATPSDVSTLQPATASASCFQATTYNAGTKKGTPESACVSAGSPNCTQGATQIPGFTSSYSYGISGLGGCYCAFACHWVPASGATTFTANGVDTESGAVNTGGVQTYSLDYYGLARSKGVQLRFDVVQSAVETSINYMYTTEHANNISNQFGAQVFEFGNALQQDWPPTGDTAASALADMACLNSSISGCSNTALAAAQAMSSPVTADNANTDFPAAMASLYVAACNQMSAPSVGLVTGSCSATSTPTTVTPGDGSTQARAKRSLIIITDGIQDWGGRSMVNGYSLTAGVAANPNGAEGPVSANDCAKMKTLGYTIYVLYTNYITSPASVVLNNGTLINYVNGTTGTAYDLPTNLAGCATTAADYAPASVPADITTTLQNMVKAAINGGAVLTK
jgi:Putative Flp pilus-assembly TadE/G-like